MAHNLGDCTTLFEGTLRAGGRSCEGEIDHIAVNGFCQDDQEHWTSEGIFWPREYLLKENTRFLLASNCLLSDPSIKSLLNYGETLLGVIENYLSNAPLVVHCFGLGGIIFLKALRQSEARGSERKLSSRIAGIFFYGTPLVFRDRSAMKKTLQDCLLAESQLQQSSQFQTSIDERTMDEIDHLLYLANKGDFITVSFFESQETTLSRRGIARIKPRRRILVPEALVKGGKRVCISINRHHNSIAHFDQTLARNLLAKIDEVIAQYNERQGNSQSLELSEQSEHLTISSSIEIDNPQMSDPSHQAPERPATPRISVAHIAPQVRKTREKFHAFNFVENENFFGRSGTLANIEQALAVGLGSQSDSRAYAIFGASGSGKTQTALKFAYSHKNTYDYIFWVSSETESKLIQSFSEYAGLLGLVSDGSQRDPVNDSAVLKRWLESIDSPWLIIFDNTENPSLLLDYWPRSQWGAILVTALSSTFADPEYCGKGEELFQLDEASSIQFLLSSLDLPATESEVAREIVKRFGCLPVAIRTSIGQIRETKCSLDEYNKEWNNPQSIFRAHVKYVDSKYARYNKSLLDLYAKSLRDLGRDARSLVNIFALMDDEHIPKEMFQLSSSNTKLHFLGRLNGLILDLTNSSLVGTEIETSSTSSQQYHIHRMIRAFIQMQMGDSEDRQIAFESASILLDQRVTDGNSPRFPANKSYFQHVKSLWTFYKSETERSTKDPTIRLLLPCPAFIRVLRKMSWWCYRMSFHTSAEQFMVTIDEIREHYQDVDLGPEMKECLEIETVWNHYQYASLHTDFGKFRQSLEKFELCLKAYNAVPESKRAKLVRLFVIYGGLGNSYNGLHLQVEAEKFYKKSLEILPENARLLDYEVNICQSLYDQGPQRYKEASDRIEDIIRRREKAFGPDDDESYLSSHTFYVAGQIRLCQAQDPNPHITQEQRQKWLDSAFEYHTKSLKLAKRTFGMGHHKTADAAVRYAWHLHERGKYDEVITQLKEALEIFQSAANREHRQAEIARTYFKISLALDKKGEEDEAERFRTKAEKIRKAILKEDFTPCEGLKSYDNLVSFWQL